MINIVDSEHPLYCFGYFRNEIMPRPLVSTDLENYRPATQEELIAHHQDMARNVLLHRVGRHNQFWNSLLSFWRNR